MATCLLPVCLVTSLPTHLLAQATESVREVSVAVADSLKPAPLEVKINRTLPPGVVPVDQNARRMPQASQTLRFSPEPKDREFADVHFFEEPLIPTAGESKAGENAALAKALLAYSSAQRLDEDQDDAGRLSPVRQFLSNYPHSKWALALWLNTGITYRRTGYWTRALDAWEHAWAAGKTAQDPKASALADRAVAELAELNARLGRFERLGPLFAELDGAQRALRGSAADKLAGARQGLWTMDHQPDRAFRCGPMALGCLLRAKNPDAALDLKIFNAASTRQGISLDQVAALSRDIDRPMQMAYRLPGGTDQAGDFVTPAIVHWKAGHYAALVERRNGLYRVDDPTFGDTAWVSRAALLAETDGYFLIDAARPLPAGWRTVDVDEGKKVWGKGVTNGGDSNCTSCLDPNVKDCLTCPPGMAYYNVHTMLVSLSLGDTPLSYTPPRGRPISFGVQYAQREANQPAVFDYWNLGPKWTSQWMSYIRYTVRIDESNGAQLGARNDQPANRPQPESEDLAGAADYLPASWQPGTDGDDYRRTDGLTSAARYVRITPISADLYMAGGGMEVYGYAGDDVDSSYTGGMDLPNHLHSKFVPKTRNTGYIVEDSAVSSDNNNHDLKQPTGFTRYLPDGSKEIYGQPNLRSSQTGTGLKYFLTQRIDPSGNTTTFSYDAQVRLVAVTDALGQVTTLSYGLSADPLKVTQVTDPFGRSCSLAYNAQGQLQTITDSAGMQSVFGYKFGSDFLNALTTPYGTTTFAFGDVTTDPALGPNAWLEATDPYGDKERVERNQDPQVTKLPNSEAAPQTIPTFNNYLYARNTFYWDKKAYQGARRADGSLDYALAKTFHFLHDIDTSRTSGILESTKSPLESRVWLFYQGQLSAGFFNVGMSTNPSMVARLLDDGSTQLSRYEYNAQQRVTKATDPLGRETRYDYDTNGMDLLGVRWTTGALNERLMSTTYNAAHQPLTMTDASGQTTTLTYNGFGQVHTVTDATNRTVTYQYDAQGYLTEIDGFDPALRTTFGYDGFGRLSSTTSYPDAYTLSLGYEVAGGNPLLTLNRPVCVTYPDGSYAEVDYNKLDVEWTRDRGGNWSRLLTNKLRQTEAAIDPLGHVTQFGYCKCGQLVKLIDPNGNVTQWKLDGAERPIAKVYADNTEVDYAYEETTSRLKRVTDAKGQKTHYSYFLDGALQSVNYTEAEHATPGVSYTYDPLRGRLATMTDGIGTTTYSYYPLASGSTAGTAGAGRVQSVSGPFANETVSYEYDALGRMYKTTVNGTEETLGFDGLGRLQTDTNALGAFTYGYEGATGRLGSVLYPNGQEAHYAYYPGNAQDRRLSQIKHLLPSGATLDQFDYAYDGPLGRISHWGQTQPGSTGALESHAYDLSYDATGQLVRAVYDQDESSANSGVWSYDAAGNRVNVQTGAGTLTTAIPTATNALIAVRGGGRVRVAGGLSEWASVTINGQAASVDTSTNTFEAFVPLGVGSQALAISATDASGNSSTKSYQLTISEGVSMDLGYDANGNTTVLAALGNNASPAQSFEWDACNRITAISNGSHRIEYGYNGDGVRVRFTEKENGSVVSDHIYIDGEERDASTGQVLRRFFSQGEQEILETGANTLFYGSDHLNSVHVLSNNAGVVQASYAYGPWGNRKKISGSVDTITSYTGYLHQFNQFELSPTRIYNPQLGRFISRDMIEEHGGINLYSYADNNPILFIDPFGFDPVSVTHRTVGNIMVHSEVPIPNGGNGNVHLQIGGEKFFFDTKTSSFPGLPKNVYAELKNNKSLQNGIKNAVNRCNLNGGFDNKYGGGVGKYVPFLAVAVLFASGTAQADAMDINARNYVLALSTGDEAQKLSSAALISNQVEGIAPGAGIITLGNLLDGN